MIAFELEPTTASAMISQSYLLREMITGRLRQSYGGTGPLTALEPAGGAVACVTDCAGEHPFAAWLQPFGAWGALDGNANAVSLNYSTGGFLAGIDATFDGTWRAGLAGGYSRSSFNQNGLAASSASDNYHLALWRRPARPVGPTRRRSAQLAPSGLPARP